MGVGDLSPENRFRGEDVAEMLGHIAEETHRIAVEIEPLVEISPPNWAYHVVNIVQMLEVVAEQMGAQYQALLDLMVAPEERIRQREMEYQKYSRKDSLDRAVALLWRVVHLLAIAHEREAAPELNTARQEIDEVAIRLGEYIARTPPQKDYP